jgi:hypothetical protein
MFSKTHMQKLDRIAHLLIFSCISLTSLISSSHAQNAPQPSLSIDFDAGSLAKLGASFPSGEGFTFITGKDGHSAVQFHGGTQSSVIQIPNSDKLQFKDAASFDLWVRLDDLGGMDGYGITNNFRWTMSIIAKSHDRNGFFVGAAVNRDEKVSGDAGFFASNDQTWGGVICDHEEDIPVLAFGEWYRLTAVASSQSGTHIYINRKLATSCLNARPSFSASNTQDLFIGRFKDKWYPFSGAIQDLRIYQIALSAEEVKNLP